jgi:hypothetical protein
MDEKQKLSDLHGARTAPRKAPHLLNSAMHPAGISIPAEYVSTKNIHSSVAALAGLGEHYMLRS